MTSDSHVYSKYSKNNENENIIWLSDLKYGKKNHPDGQEEPRWGGKGMSQETCEGFLHVFRLWRVCAKGLLTVGVFWT